MLLTHRKLLQSKAIAIENDLRGTLAVTLFEAYFNSGNDLELQAWAAKNLPALKEHLEHAKKLK